MARHLQCPEQILCQSSGAVLASCSSSSSFSRCTTVKVSFRQHCPLSTVPLNLAQRKHSCRAWKPSAVTTDRCQMSKCRQATDTPPELLEDSKIEEDDDEDDYPLWMEEDDPTWPEDDPNGDGYGFQISNFFEPKITNVPTKDGSTDEEQLDINWEAEQYQWIIREITASEWTVVALEDPTPLIFFAFERYGPSGPQCWQLLEELEKVVRKIIDSRRYPIRAVKLDVSSEPDVGTALKIKRLPTLLFINGGKCKYQFSGVKTADELLAITSHVFYHSVRPACMDEVETSHTVTDISLSR